MSNSQAVLFALAVQRGHIDAQRLRRDFIRGAVRRDIENVCAREIGQTDRIAGAHTPAVLGTFGNRQFFDIDLFVGAENDRTLDDVLQLSDIARPRIANNGVDRFHSKRARRAMVILRIST